MPMSLILVSHLYLLTLSITAPEIRMRLGHFVFLVAMQVPSNFGTLAGSLIAILVAHLVSG